jgi:long-chain acyl-CoA synthetase
MLAAANLECTVNVAELLWHPNSDATALSGANGSISFGALRADVAKLSTAFCQLGLKRGDRVAIVLSNTPSHVLTYFSVLAAGSVAVSLNPKLVGREIGHALAMTRPAIVITEKAALGQVRQGLAMSPGRPMLIADGICAGSPSIPALLETSTPSDHIAAIGVDDPCSILFTSGSSGRPKGVTLTHANVMWAARAKASRMCLTEDDAVALIAPLHHAYGQNAVLNAAFCAGASVVLFDPMRRRRLVRDLDAFAVTALPSVPAVFQLLLDLGACREQLPDLRCAVSAAAPLPRQVADEWLRCFGFRLHEGYGLTETSPCALYNDAQSSAAGSIGRPYQQVATKIVDISGAEVATGEIGELLISGPNVMAGYFEDPAATAEVVVDGWLHTGDLVWRDADGDHWFASRAKNVIIVSGVNVHPPEVESVLRGHPDVVQAVAVGQPHPIVGEVVVAYVELQQQTDRVQAVSRLRRLCEAELAPYKRPALIKVVDSIPLLPSGKPDLQTLRLWLC